MTSNTPGITFNIKYLPVLSIDCSRTASAYFLFSVVLYVLSCYVAIGSLFFELVCVNVGVRGVCRGVQGTMSDEGENSQMLNVAISLFLCTREVICLILLARL